VRNPEFDHTRAYPKVKLTTQGTHTHYTHHTTATIHTYTVHKLDIQLIQYTKQLEIHKHLYVYLNIDVEQTPTHDLENKSPVRNHHRDRTRAAAYSRQPPLAT
jgi:hypothetical protein